MHQSKQGKQWHFGMKVYRCCCMATKRVSGVLIFGSQGWLGPCLAEHDIEILYNEI